MARWGGRYRSRSGDSGSAVRERELVIGWRYQDFVVELEAVVLQRNAVDLVLDSTIAYALDQGTTFPVLALLCRHARPHRPCNHQRPLATKPNNFRG